MTAKEFVNHIEGYYGPYERVTTKAYVVSWASEVEYALDKLWPEVVKEFSGKYGKAPDIAVLEEIAATFNGERYNPWGDPGVIPWREALKPQKEPIQLSEARKELEG